MNLQTTDHRDEWNSWCEELGLEDAYYRWDYLEIWHDEENAEPLGVRFDADAGVVIYPVLKQPLGFLDGGDGHVDVRTPYDFGGPLAMGQEADQVQSAFQEAWAELAADWNVVTEFARLHPYKLTARPADAEFHADNIHTDLRDGYEAVYSDYHTNQRNFVRKAEEAGVTVQLAEEPGRRHADGFLRCYYATMEAVGANPNYFYRPETLRSLIGHPNTLLASASYDGQLIAAAIFLRADDVIYYFLSGSDRDHLDVRPNNLILDRVVSYGIEHDFRYCHLGGGSEGVRHFKSQIGNGTVPYYVLTRVHDEETYDRLVARNHATDEDHFPAYRLRRFSDRETPPDWKA